MNKSYFFSSKKILEFSIILIFSFWIFSIQFGGLPSGEWLALNVFPIIAGLLTWIIFNIILLIIKNNSQKIKYLFCFIVTVIPTIIIILFLLKKM
ncbi:hypothetical protein B0A65_23030 [Flavobacterium frigidimaris]|uniref:Phospholipase_D-nuclease N-terminal n=1 Tax=Flavobacterium frigidimaris TaxID=262320 RepID=A0ABX4BJH8_FLAFR|nr:hypothetical protein B0A65_23030 [Flavobacterium frigidimaris]